MRRLLLYVLLLASLATSMFAADLSKIVGVGWWGFPKNGYWFPASLQWCLNGQNQPYLVTTPCNASATPVNDLAEGADRLLAAGSRVLYLPLNANPVAWFKYNNPPLQTTIGMYPPNQRLREIAKMAPYASTFQKNFNTFVLAVGTNVPLCGDTNPTYNGGTLVTPGHACPCGSGGACVEKMQYFGLEGLLGTGDYSWAPVMDGMTAAEQADETAAIKNLAVYLLQNTSFNGKTFIIADVEGDWALRSDHYGDETWEPDASTVPSKATRIDAMKKWYQARQYGVNQARFENPNSLVKVYHAAEVNKVEWAMPPNNRMTVTNDVLPGLPGCCDLYSYSYWDANPYTPAALTARLDYLGSKVPDIAPFGRFNVMVSEYGGGSSLINGELLSRRLTEAAIGWGSPYIVYWQLYDGSLPNVNLPANVRATNSDTDASGLVRPDGTLTALHGYVQNVTARGLLRAALRTYNNTYVGADNGGGGIIHVTATTPYTWEEISIIDRNGGSLVSGDSVNLLTHDGHYFMAWDLGGGAIEASAEHDLAWEQFTILKQNGTGTIGIGDTIALRSGNGHYVVAEGGGGGNNILKVDRTVIGPWEKFTLVTLP